MSDPLDQTLLNEPAIITNHFGSVYSNWGVTTILGAIFFMGCYTISGLNPVGIIIGVIMVLIGLVGLTFTYGAQVDVNNNRYRDYISILLVKMGKWKSLNLYPYITVLKTNKGRSAFAGLPMSAMAAATGSADYSDGEFAVYLLNKSHYQKIEIELHDDIKKAKERLSFFASKMNKEIVTYNPVRISKRR